MLTKEQFDKLSELPEIPKAFETLRCCGFCRNLVIHVMNRLNEINIQLVGRHIDFNCSTCVAREMQRLSQLYYEYLEQNN